MIRFTFFTGDCNWQEYGGKFISKKQNNGEFDFWFILDVVNWFDAVGEREAPAKYNVSLQSVSITEAGEEELKKAFECCGYEEEDIADATEEQKLDALLSYGVYATLWSESGNNLNKLMKEGRNQAQIASMLYGFYMDRQQNAIGNTRWDFQRGQITFNYAQRED
jgi:hypothetical protein